jgi:hypothetical protein
MKMIEVVTQIRYEKGTRHIPYTPFWINPNNLAIRMKVLLVLVSKPLLIPPILPPLEVLPLHVLWTTVDEEEVVVVV